MAIEFDNPVVAGTVLVRSAIQSPDYDPGVSGWAVFSDGTAEFNDVDVRGLLTVLGDEGRYLSLTILAGVPIMALYPGDPGNGHTMYRATMFAVKNPSLGNQQYLSIEGTMVDALGTAKLLLFGADTNGNPPKMYVGPASYSGTIDIILDGNVSVRSDLTVDGFLRADPTVASVVDTGNTGPAANNVEAVFLTSSSGDFKAGRAYEVRHTGRFTVTTGGTAPIFRFRQGSTTAGTLLGLPGRLPSSGTAGAENNAECSAKFVCSSDVTDSVCLTINSGTAGVTVTSLGTFTGRTLEVKDIGDATKWAGLPAIS